MVNERIVKEIVNLQLSTKIIKHFRNAGIFSENLGSSAIVLYALRDDKLSILDELDDASNAKRMMYLYQTLNKLNLVEEEDKDAYSYYKITNAGRKLLSLIDEEINDEIVESEPLVQASTVVAAQEVAVETDWIKEYIELFPKNKRAHPKIIEERFEKFAKMFPEYYKDKKLIIAATKAYIKDANSRDGGVEYIRKCEYYIWKSEPGSVIYDLATWCEKVLNNKNEPTTDWSTEFMNLA